MKAFVVTAVAVAVLTCFACAGEPFAADLANKISFDPMQCRFVRLVILESVQAQPCIDELEVYSAQGGANLALAVSGAKAAASSCLAGYAIHQVSHLNDGLYGNSHSWIAAGTQNEWVQIEFPTVVSVGSVIFSRDREGRYSDRLPASIEIRISTDGANWKTVASRSVFPMLPVGRSGQIDLLPYAFECEDLTWRKYDSSDSLSRVLGQIEEIIGRFSTQGLDVSQERLELAEFRRRQQLLEESSASTREKEDEFFKVRLAKRRLFLRAPGLSGVENVLFVKRHAFEPSHNYSVIFDAAGDVGGGICVLEIPHLNGALVPERGVVKTLLDAGDGIVRDPIADFSRRKIYFAYRRSKNDYFNLYVMNSDGSDLKQLTGGPFHDYFPCPLPDGGLGFVSTRCKSRFLCWRPQAFVLFRMDADGGNIKPLSYANLSEWTPSVMNDGRIMWMRSEYLDKGADFGHTLWAIRSDGTHPELVFGNNTLNCYANGHEVPGSSEIVCTLVSHGGDLNGPVALVDVGMGRFNPAAIKNITPDVEPHYHMSWARHRCFRDPIPVSRDYFLCSHAPLDKFGLYIIDRYGNRELVYLDGEIGSMSPTLLQSVSTPPVLGGGSTIMDESSLAGQFFVADVYQGLGDGVKIRTAKYIRVCQEVRADLRQLANGEYQADHEPFEDWYATPTHKVGGPYGWPSYVAKGVIGTAIVEEDGSANFYAPSGKVLYFQLLDVDYNEIQRMRSVIQLQPGERRSCIGCHEDRMRAPPSSGRIPMAMRREAEKLKPPPWGAGPFSYERVVQPVWDEKCVRCHNADDGSHLNLTGVLDGDKVPASYRAIVGGGWVHYFDYNWGREHSKAEPLSFGTVKSRLWEVLTAGHYKVRLSKEEARRVKCWTDLNCPLWPDYVFRPNRSRISAAAK
ncbi:MAG: discoidin domain-containing protein [Sedimentisphaerales bacterium]|nr:discoidin domain-containing protein [Sedimentisphaerales bacterium]